MPERKRQQGQGEIIRSILSGMILSTPVLARIASQWDGEMFGRARKDPNIIGRWCVDYFNQCGQAPGREQIGTLLAAWSSTQTDADLITNVERLLEAASNDHAANPDEINVDYLTDQASKIIDAAKLADNYERTIGFVNSGHLDKAIEEHAKFRRVNLGPGSGVKVGLDDAKLRQAFEQHEGDLFRCGREALAEFWSNQLRREGFVAYCAPEKRGKCVSEDMMVPLADGRVMSIGRIVRTRETTPILSLNEATQQMIPVHISDFWNNGRKECFRVVTFTGRSVTTTGNHQYLTPDGWKFLQDIQPGDFIAVPKKLSFFGGKELPIAEVRALGFLLADGSCTASQLSFTKTDPELVAAFKDCCDELGIETRRKGIGTFLKGSGWLRRKYPGALWQVTSKTKRIPAEIFTCPKSQVAEFLRVFFSCDGYVANGGVGMTLANKTMLRQVSHLLHRFGIVHSFRYKPVRLNDRKFQAWVVSIRSQEYVDLFFSEIGMMSYKHRDVVGCDNQKSFLDKFPWQVAERFLLELKDSYPDGIRKSMKKGKGQYVRKGWAFREAFDKAPTIREQIAKKQPLMRQSFAAADPNNTVVRKYMGSDILWDRVMSVRSVGMRQTYDLSVPETHNFVANDCLVHNTFQLVDMAYHAASQRRKVVFFAVGDMGETDMLRRFSLRAGNVPLRPCTANWPTGIKRAKGEAFAVPEHTTRVFDKGMTYEDARRGFERMRRLGTKSNQPYLMLYCYPNSTATVKMLDGVIQDLARQDEFVADVVIIDYADILAPPPGIKDLRDQINANWKAMRALSQARHCLVVTATQTDAASYDATSIRRRNFADDKRKYGHVTGMVSINQTDDEKKLGVTRLGWLLLREGSFQEDRFVHCAGCLDLGKPNVRSCW